MLTLNEIHRGDCVSLMAQLPDRSIDLTVTSPPYDGLRTYNGYSFDFEAVAAELFRVTKPGGVVVWVVGDATVKGSKTGTSFRQALHFIQCGFGLHDTIIYKKGNPGGARGSNLTYWQAFEYMFVFSKGQPVAFNPILDRPNAKAGRTYKGGGRRNKDGTLAPAHFLTVPAYGRRTNVWEYTTGGPEIGHPAIFPEKLAADHILSWSNPGDIVLDPFSGSGTTAKMALVYGRKYLGFEISGEYAQRSRARLAAVHPALDFGKVTQA